MNFHRSHALRGNAYSDAPASRERQDAGASRAEFPRGAWELCFALIVGAILVLYELRGKVSNQ